MNPNQNTSTYEIQVIEEITNACDEFKNKIWAEISACGILVIMGMWNHSSGKKKENQMTYVNTLVHHLFKS